MWIDAHCHLDDEAYANDLDAVIDRAREAGMKALITAGADLASSRAAVALAERYPEVYAVVGVHPQYAATWDDEMRRALWALAHYPKVVGIGEIGLDLHYPDSAPLPVQVKALEAQLDIAQELAKPVVIHDRDAHVPLMEILERRQSKPRGMLHCFSGDGAMADKAVALGHCISFAGNVTFANARALQAVAIHVPLDHLLVETDSPYLSPQRGKRNEPQNVVEVGKKIAELKRVDWSVVDEATRRNSELLFGVK